MHGTVEKTIEAIEKTIAWRRDRNMYDIDAFAKEVEDEVSIYRHGVAGPGCSMDGLARCGGDRQSVRRHLAPSLCAQ